MLDVDRAVLRNVLIVALASTAGLVLVGTSCLGTQMARLDRAAGLGRDPSRSSAGGVPVGSATLASATVRRQPPRPPPHAPPPLDAPEDVEDAPDAPAHPNGTGFEVPNLGQPGLRGMPGMMPGMRTPIPAPQGSAAPHGGVPAPTAPAPPQR